MRAVASTANHPDDPTNEMRLPSGDHTGSRMESLAATVNGGPSICETTQRRAAASSSRPAQAIDFPSGGHASEPPRLVVGEEDSDARAIRVY